MLSNKGWTQGTWQRRLSKGQPLGPSIQCLQENGLAGPGAMLFTGRRVLQSRHPASPSPHRNRRQPTSTMAPVTSSSSPHQGVDIGRALSLCSLALHVLAGPLMPGLGFFCLTRLSLFCLERLSRHYLPPVAASGEKDESEVRTSGAVQKR